MRIGLMSIVCLVIISNGAIAEQTQYNPNTDEVYVQLKSKSMNDLTEREFEYLMLKEKECINYNQLNYKGTLENQLELSMSDDTANLAEKQVDINKSQLNWYKFNSVLSAGSLITSTLLLVLTILN